MRPRKEPNRSKFNLKMAKAETHDLIVCAKEMIAESKSVKADMMKSFSEGIGDILKEIAPIREDIKIIRGVIFGIPGDPNSPYDNFIHTHEENTKIAAAEQRGVKTGVRHAGVSREFTLKIWQLIVGGIGVIATSAGVQTLIEAIFKAGGKP
jgi:hypothetical protein